MGCLVLDYDYNILDKMLLNTLSNYNKFSFFEIFKSAKRTNLILKEKKSNNGLNTQKKVDKYILNTFSFYTIIFLSKILNKNLKVAFKIQKVKKRFYFSNSDLADPSLFCLFAPSNEFIHLYFLFSKRIPIICFYNKKLLFKYLYIINNTNNVKSKLFFLFYIKAYFQTKVKTKSQNDFTKKQIFFCMHKVFYQAQKHKLR